MIDPHSYARPAEARVTHVALDLRADFTRKVLEGTATLTLQAAADAREVVLDTRGLEIQGVADARGAALTYALGPADPILGSALTITLPADRATVVVRYRTSPQAEALQWLSPAQTAGGAHPVPVLAGPGDPHAHVDPHAGQPGSPPDVPRPHRRARAVTRGDERRGADAGRHAGRRRPRLRVRARAAGAALSDCHRDWRHRRSNPSDRDRASMPSRRWSSARPPSLPTSRR